MASNSPEYGYEDERFQYDNIDSWLSCPICLEILKDPRMCRANQHMFCLLCITRHLANSSTCPVCRDELTIETLNQAPRFILNRLSNIDCDYYSRGCRECILPGNRKTHVLNCGFAPVRCSNFGCVAEINKRDRVYDEVVVCEFRKVKCHDCSEIRKDVDELKQNQAGLTEDVTELKQNQVEIKEQLNEVKNMLVQVLNKFQPALHVKSARKENIIIAGGSNAPFHDSRSVETFSWDTVAWYQLSPLNQPRSSASSIVYKNRNILVGGWSGSDAVDNMEMMNTDYEPSQWITFPAKLPAKLFDHTTVVYEDRLIVIGGYNETEARVSDAIYEVHLIHPYSTRLLGRMPQPRLNHGTELVSDKIFIFGGSSDFMSERAIDSVVVYDVFKNKYKHMRSLPYAVWGMSTVRWRNKVVVVGGQDKDGQILNDVITYNIESEESESLPSLHEVQEVGLFSGRHWRCHGSDGS